MMTRVCIATLCVSAVWPSDNYLPSLSLLWLPPVKNGDKACRYLAMIQGDDCGKGLAPFLAPTERNHFPPQFLLNFKGAQKAS